MRDTADLAPSEDKPILGCNDLSVAYVPGVWVLRHLSLALPPSTVTAVVGENGAGKSTLYKVLAGLVAPTHGTLSIEGHEYGRLTPAIARSKRIAYVSQELAPCPDLRVFENVFLGTEKKMASGLTDRKKMARQTAEMIHPFGLQVDPMARVGSLSTAALQVLEIVRSARAHPKVWILDEPTASLADTQAEELFRMIEKARARGAAIVYTTHRMEEINRLADRVLVLRDGTVALDRSSAGLTLNAVLAAMLGRDASRLYRPLPAVKQDAEIALHVDDLMITGLPSRVSLEVRRGEVVGVAGLLGSGRSTLVNGIFGLNKTVGKIEVRGKPLSKRRGPAEAIRAGVTLVPEDRKAAGLVLDLAIKDNATLHWLDHFVRAKVVRRDRARTDTARTILQRSRLRHGALGARTGNLSGGNQQKVVLARSFIGSMTVLLLDEPTRGVDAGAREEIYEVIRELLREGVGILMVSSDRDEVVNLAHRVLVMKSGRIVGQVDASSTDAKEAILRLALGYAGPPRGRIQSSQPPSNKGALSSQSKDS